MQKKTNRGTAAKAMKNVKAKDAKTAKALTAKQRAAAKVKQSGTAHMTAPKSSSPGMKSDRRKAHISNLHKYNKAHDKHAAAKKVSDSTRKKK